MISDHDRERLLDAFAIWQKWGHVMLEGRKPVGIDTMLTKPVAQLWPDIYNEGFKAGQEQLWRKGRWGLQTAVTCLWLVNGVNMLLWILSAAVR